MKKLRFAFGGVVVVAAVAFWVGCGSSSDNGLINGGDDGGAEAATPPPTPPPNPPPPPNDAGNDAADLPDGSIAADGGQNVQDAGPGGNTTTLPCGTATCAIPGQSCCVTTGGGGGGGGTSYLCVVGPSSNCPAPPGGGNGDVTALKCSGAANCAANEVCCVTQPNNGAPSSSCVAAGSCTGQNSAILCDKTAVTTGCDAGVLCSSNNIGDWGLPNTFATCGGKGN